MKNDKVKWQWTQSYSTWQPMANHAQTQEQMIEQKLASKDLAEARAVLQRIMAI